MLRPRTRAAIARSQTAGIPVIVATGRMFRSVRPYLEDAGIAEPVVCYQGAVGRRSGERRPSCSTSRSRSRPPARRSRAARRRRSFRRTATSTTGCTSRATRSIRDVRGLPAPPGRGGRRPVAWLERPPTKLVAVADPPRSGAARGVAATFGGRLYLTTSLPFLLELGNPGVSKGTGLAFVADRLGLDARADRLASATARTTSS